MAIEDLANELTRGLEPPVSRVCVDLLVQFSKIPTGEQRRMSFKWLAALVNLRWDSPEFQSAISALTTMREHPLTLYFVMWDEAEQREIPVELGYFKEAVQEHCFIHPRTGEEVENFEDQLVPVFRLSQAFSARLNESRS